MCADPKTYGLRPRLRLLKSHKVLCPTRRRTNLEVRYLTQVTQSLIFKSLDINRFCMKLRTEKPFRIWFVLLQYDLFYCNFLNNNSRTHMQSLPAYFFQYRDRLSCYLTRTFRSWAYLAGFQEYNSRTDPFGKWSISLYARWTYKAR